MATNIGLSYANSGDIAVFPVSNRGPGYNVESRLMTELNITNIVNKLVDMDGFVITDDAQLEKSTINNGSNVSFEFNINGYYFKIKDLYNFLRQKVADDGNEAPSYVTAYIACEETNGFKELKTIETSDTGLDVDSEFRGVGFHFDNNGYEENAFAESISYPHLNLFTARWSGPQGARVLKCEVCRDSLVRLGGRSVILDDGELM